MPKVELNTRAPEIDLNDFLGNPVSLSLYRNSKNLLLVFNRGFT